MQTRIHRYSIGVSAVSAVGIAVLGVGVWLLLKGSAQAAAEDDGETAARAAGAAVRQILETQVERRGRPEWTKGSRPIDAAEANFPMAEVSAIPGVEAVIVRSPEAETGPPTFATDPRWTASAHFVPTPPTASEIRIARDGGSDPPGGGQYVASFQLPSSSHRLAAASVNVRFRPPHPGRARETFEGNVLLGAVIMMLVIYFLGMFSYFIRRSGEELVIRDREMSARLKAVRDVSGGIAHELRNPLNAIGLSVQVIERKLPGGTGGDSAFARHFERVHLEIGRIKKVVDAFVKFARLGDLTVVDMDFGALIRELVAGFDAVFTEARVRATCEAADDVTLRGDREKLGEAVSSVIQTAVEAMREGGGELTIRLTASRREAKLMVRDSGPSLDEARLRNIFEPYRYGRDQEGFGLTVAKTIIESHGGRIEAASPPEGGCVVTVSLPRRFA